MGKKEEKERLPGLELASSYSSCTQAIWTGGLFFCFCFDKKYRSTHDTYTRDTRHTARSAQTWMVMYPKAVPAQATQSCGKPCVFKEILVRMSKKHIEK